MSAIIDAIKIVSAAIAVIVMVVLSCLLSILPMALAIVVAFTILRWMGIA